MIRRLLALLHSPWHGAMAPLPPPPPDDDWRPIADAPPDCDVLVYRHDGNAPWSYGFVEIAFLAVEEGEGDAGWWLADGSTPITPPILWKPIERPKQPGWWQPRP